MEEGNWNKRKDDELTAGSASLDNFLKKMNSSSVVGLAGFFAIIDQCLK